MLTVVDRKCLLLAPEHEEREVAVCPEAVREDVLQHEHRVVVVARNLEPLVDYQAVARGPEIPQLSVLHDAHDEVVDGLPADERARHVPQRGAEYVLQQALEERHAVRLVEVARHLAGHSNTECNGDENEKGTAEVADSRRRRHRRRRRRASQHRRTSTFGPTK